MRHALAWAAVCAATLSSPLEGAPASRAQSVANHPRVSQAIHLMETWLDAHRAYEQIPGLSAGVVHDQTLIWSGGFGFADLARKAPATPSTIYSICSISKLFTAIAVMQQRDAGKLRLDDPVGRHLPWFTIRQAAGESPDVTIEGLLTHASGLPRESDHPYWTGPDFAFPTREEIVQRLGNQEMLYPAETYFQYSNLGLALAGEVAAAAAGVPYADYVRRHILEPLLLTSTSPEMPERHRGGRLATGYSAITREGTRRPLPFFQVRGIAPAAGFASTVEDLARFASWQFRLLQQGGTEVLKATTLREMQRVHWVDPDFETTWGLGFTVSRTDGKTFVGHGGSCPGYRTQLLLKTDDKLAAIVMANALGVNPGSIAQRMYGIMAPAIKAAKEPGKTAGDSGFARYTGTYEASFGGEIAVFEWEDGLATLSLPTAEPVRNLSKLRRTAEHSFRRVRRDDALGESVVFEMGSDGRPTRMRWHSNYYRRIR